VEWRRFVTYFVIIHVVRLEFLLHGDPTLAT